MKYCPYCGNAVQEAFAFCPNCGMALAESAQPGMISLSPSQRRVPMGSLSHLINDEQALNKSMTQPISVPVESEEAKYADAPFDSNTPPQAGDLVPADCVWAYAVYPGPPQSFWPQSKLIRTVEMLGVVSGRTMEELVTALGRPVEHHQPEEGVLWLLWRNAGWKVEELILTFDAYDVCYGIGDYDPDAPREATGGPVGFIGFGFGF